MKTRTFLSTLLIALLSTTIFINISAAQETGRYFGLTLPDSPEPFATGVIGNYNCGAITFSPDGKWCFFNHRVSRHGFVLMMMHQDENGVWSEPETAPFSGQYKDMEPVFAPDGRLFFASNRCEGEWAPTRDTDIFFTELDENGQWKTPQRLSEKVNKPMTSEYFATLTTDQKMYYRGIGKKGDIFIYNLNEKEKDPFSFQWNSPHNDSHPFISSDGKMLLFDSNRPDGFGGTDLYICFRDNDGNWHSPINCGALINDEGSSMLPMLSQDNKILFFVKIIPGRGPVIHWVSTKFIDEF